MQCLGKLGKFTHKIWIFLLLFGNLSGHWGFFSASWEKFWYWKPVLVQVLYREKALRCYSSPPCPVDITKTCPCNIQRFLKL